MNTNDEVRSNYYKESSDIPKKKKKKKKRKYYDEYDEPAINININLGGDTIIVNNQESTTYRESRPISSTNHQSVPGASSGNLGSELGDCLGILAKLLSL